MLRALVMLASLIAIPVAALCGSSAPAVLKALQQGRLPTLAELRGSSSAVVDSFGQPSRFALAGSGPAVSGGTAPPDMFHASAAGWPASNAEPGRSPVVPAGFQTPIDPSGASRGQAALAAMSGGYDIPGRSASPLSPLPPGGVTLVPVDRSANPAPEAPARTGNEQFTYVQDRLRQMGATYYLLESWGDQKQEYRFYCRMAIGGNSQYTRSFWAIDNDPLRAMNQVLDQVESWRSAAR
jgi:hypothetical protein